MKKLSNLLLEWTTALIEINTNHIKACLLKEPDLLWTPIPHTLDEFADLQSRLDQRLGTSFQPVCAIQFLCLTLDCFEMKNKEYNNALCYLIEQSSVQDLDTRSWGECNNSTLHLVCFLENQFMVRLLIEKGVSPSIPNDLGYLPKDVIQSTFFMQEYTQLQQQKSTRMKTWRPNYSTPDRFKLLKELAEESTSGTDKKQQGLKNEGRYFRKGLVKESQKKVLTEDDAQKDHKRKLEVDQLAKRSAVKNNPLFQQFEKNNLVITPKKVVARQPNTVHTLVNTLRQTEEPKPVETKELKKKEVARKEVETKQVERKVEKQVKEAVKEPAEKTVEEAVKEPVEKTVKELVEEALKEPVEEEEEEEEFDTSFYQQPEGIDSFYDMHPEEEKRKSRMRNSIILLPTPMEEKRKSRMLPQNEARLEEESFSSFSSSSSEDEVEENATPVQVATRLVSPVYHTGKVLDEKPVRPQRSELRDDHHKRQSGSQKASWTMSMSSWAAILDREFNLSEIDQENKLKEHQRQAEEEESTKLELSEQEMLAMQEAQLAYLDVGKGTCSSDSTKSLEFTDTSRPVALLPDLTSSKSIRRKPLTTVSSEPVLPKKQPQKKREVDGYGKLYLHVNGIQDILLPLPKERAYVRCVVSDGRFEYMSRYEVLDQNMNFDYECVIDTHPGMIITLSLHVRPDYIMKSRTPFSRLFSKKKKKKESLSGYVNKEDGAIGQARFALTHMLPACTEMVYPAGFHCFNAWYSKSLRQRHKKLMDKDVLKVVGNFDVEMVFLPLMEDPKAYPRSLKEYNELLKLYNTPY